jgi:aminopeptidase N
MGEPVKARRMCNLSLNLNEMISALSWPKSLCYSERVENSVMRPISLIILTGIVAISAAVLARAESEDSIECRKSAAFLAPIDPPDQRQYAPDRDVQALHLAIDVTPDFQRRMIQAKTSLKFKPIAKPVREIKLDAVDLDVSSVTASEQVQAYQVTEDKLIVTFTSAIPVDRETTVTISYSAEPTEGIYFRTPEMGYREGDTHLFSQGEEIEARHWYPCLDSPNQRLTSEITCHVPQGMTVISNGKLLSTDSDPSTGLVAYHWSQEKSQANYLVSLVAGYFKKVEDKYHDIPLSFYTPASEINEANNSFRDTKDMMGFFEEEIGVAFPWDKYDQVCVNDFVAGGMENTSATTLTDSTLFTTATENIRNSEGLIAHELAHQWFGDLVTCKDWSHIWLNEGFATYYETLYEQHKHGTEALRYELYQRLRQINGMTNDMTPIVRRNFDKPGEMFGYLVYPKAGWVLHMLRAQLGEDLYRRCIKTYVQRHQFGNVVSEDLRAVIEELSGRSFDQFFDQWLYHGHFPELEITYSWEETSRLAKVSIHQTQELGPNVLLFKFPLLVRLKGKFGTLDHTIQVSKKAEDFYFPLDSAPELVRIDPEFTLMAKINFNPPRPMVGAQVNQKDDTIGRLLGIEQLAGKRDHDAVNRLGQMLREDSFYGVRVEASKALGSIHDEEALQTLLASTKQNDARVRAQVINDIGGFYDPKALESLKQSVAKEKNPAILSASVRAMAGYTGPELNEKLIEYLRSSSYRNELANAAVAGMRLQDDPALIPALLTTLKQNETNFTSGGFAQALQTLAYLSRNEEKKDDVREFLVSNVNHKKRTVQLADISGLGTLGDPKAIVVLQRFAGAAKATPQRATAERALAELRGGRKPVDDFKNLRQEVVDLEKANRDLKRELDDLKKKVDARQAAPERRSKSGNKTGL